MFRKEYDIWRNQILSDLGIITNVLTRLESEVGQNLVVIRTVLEISAINTTQVVDDTGPTGHLPRIHNRFRDAARVVFLVGGDFSIRLSKSFVERCLNVSLITEAIRRSLGSDIRVQDTHLSFVDVKPCGAAEEGWPNYSLGLDHIYLETQLSGVGGPMYRLMVEYAITAVDDGIVITCARLAKVCANDGATRAVIADAVNSRLLTPELRSIRKPLPFSKSAGLGEVHLSGEIVSDGLVVFSKAKSGRHRPLTLGNTDLGEYDAELSLNADAMADLIRRQLGTVAASQNWDFHYTWISLVSGPNFAPSVNEVQFSLSWDMMQQGGTNPAEWEYGVGATVLVGCKLSWAGGSQIVMGCGVRDVRLHDPWARWRQTGASMAIPGELVQGFLKLVGVNLEVGNIGSIPVDLPEVTRVDPMVLADRVVLRLGLKGC